ncbi:MAG: LysR family transcriptional regulator [Opitutaceae bacterium]|nr:LysR family transcriptional regulator [Opitutaceae bacterium]
MELHQLRSLVAVADTGSFTRASERVGISQPSLSQQIKTLESELGHKLFHRLGRRSVPTEAGRVFLDRARRILFEVENAAKELADSPGLGRKIVIGATPSLAPYLLPPVIQACWKRFPLLELHTREDFRSGLIRSVIEGELDLAIVSLPVRDPQVAVEVLRSERLLLVVPKNHRLAEREEVTIPELADEPFLFMGGANGLTAQTQRFFGDHQITPRVLHHVAQIKTLKALVAIGAGVSVLPQIAVEPDDHKTLAFLRLAERDPQRDLALVRHQLRYQTKGVQQFIEVLRLVLAEKI